MGGGNDNITIETTLSASGAGTIHDIRFGEGENAFTVHQGDIVASDGAQNRVTTTDGSTYIRVEGGSVKATNGGENVLNGTLIELGKDVNATGNNANNTLTVTDSINVGGMVYANAGSNNLTAGGALDVANSVIATTGAENTLAGKTIQVGGELRAESAHAKNTLTADKSMQIGGPVIAKNGTNSLTAGESIVVGKSLTADNGENILSTTGSGPSTVKIGSSMEARQGGANSILTADGGTEITLSSKMAAHSSGTNSIQAGEGSFTMSVAGNMEANTFGKNSIEARNDGAGSLTIAGNMQAGAYGKAGGENAIILGHGGNDITIAGEMKAEYKGSNTITSGDGDDKLSVKSIVADREGSQNTIAMGGGKDEITTGVIRAGNGAVVNIDMGDGEGDVLNVESSSGPGSIWTSKGGTIALATGEGDLTINAERLQASDGTITLNGKEGTKADVTINGVLQSFSKGTLEAKGLNDFVINGTDTDGIMMNTRDASTTDISAKNVTIKGTGVEWNQPGNTKDVIGVRAASGGINTIHVGENLNIDVSSEGRGSISPRLTHGLSATSLSRDTVSENKIIAEEDAKVAIRAEATATSGEASLAGMYALGTNVKGKAYNSIEANDVSIEVVGGKSSNAYGLYAKGTGNGSVGSNTIEATEGHALTVSITATTSGNSNIFDAYALYATGIGSENKIIGHSTAGASDRINIEGDIYTSRGTNSITTGDGNDIVTINGDLVVNSGRDGINGDGLNKISTGAGDDIVFINGDIKVGNIGNVNGKGVNLIETGEGNDIVYLNGKIDSAGSLNLDMGTDVDGNDHDILVLTAGSYKEFVDMYGDWLQSGALKNAGVEQIHINGIHQDEINKLLNYFDKKVPGFDDFPEITTSLDDTFFLDTVGIDGFNLSDLLGSYDSETGTTLDFSGKGGSDGQANEFSLDDLLKNMEQVTGIKIVGDANLDKVDVSGWKLEDTGSDRGEFLTFSQNGSMIQVQESIIDSSTMDEGMMSYLLNGGM